MNSPAIATKKRPKVFRALGNRQPPSEIVIDGIQLECIKTIKHDSWAATALFQNNEHDLTVVCKFNRTAPIFGIPMKWLGRRLARRESAMYERLDDLPNISKGFSEVYVDGKLAKNAAAHEYIDGHPLRWFDNVDDQFFEKLESTLLELHRRSIAYVDMNKSENIIVNRDGAPCLIDFQISVRLPRIWPLLWILRLLQRSDLYHCEKLKRRYRPDLLDETPPAKPWWIRMHRKIADPFRAVRRGLLVRLGIRHGKGKPQTESFIEEGLRHETGDRGQVEPIIQLHNQLLDTQYFHASGGTNEAYSQAMFRDVIGEPSSEEDQKLLKHLIRVPAFCKVVDLLRYRRTYIESQQWDPEWIDSKLEQLKVKIDGSAAAA